MPSHTKHQLAAIMFTDLVGFSLLMGKDEQKALTSLRRNTKIQNKLIKKYRGQKLKDLGDGILASFPSTSDAVCCAKEILESTKKEDWNLRIGIHLGDVIFDQGDVFGDGVNIAARIQNEAETNSIFISDTVHQNIRNKAGFEYEFIGEKKLKNIEEPIRLYNVLATPIIETQPESIFSNLGAWLNWKAFAAIGSILLLSIAYFGFFAGANNDLASTNEKQENLEKSIAVLPFKNNSSNPEENQYFCDGVMDAIRNNLSKMKALQVVSRQSVERFRNSKQTLGAIANELDVNYILDGSVRQQGEQVRVYAQLLDGSSENEIWSEMYDLKMENIFEVETELSRQIAEELKIQIAPEEERIIANVPTTNMDAYTQFLLGKEIHGRYSFTQEIRDFDNTLIQYNKALAVDPSFPEVYVAIAQLFWDRDKQAGYFNESWLDTLPVLCNKALELNPNLDSPYYLLGTYYKEKNQLERSQRNFEKALEINPNFAEALLSLGLLYSQNGQQFKALELLHKTVELDRTDFLPTLYDFIGGIYYSFGDFENGELYLKKQNELNPNQNGPLFWFMALQGRYQEAFAYAEKEYQAKPNELYSLEVMALSNMYLRNFKKSEEFFDQWIEKLQSSDSGHLANRLRNRYGYVLWENGKKEAAKAQFEINKEYLLKAVEMERSLGTAGAGMYDLAATAAFLNQKEEAYEWLREFDKNGWNWGSPYFIEVDPLFEGLFKEEAFRQIVSKAQTDKKKIREQMKLLN